MLPFILAGIGGWLIGSSSKEKEIYASGGEIENQYNGRTAKGVYELWDYGQKYEFFKDHFDGKGVYSSSEYKKLPSKKYEELDKISKDALSQHVKDGQYADGGIMANKTELSAKKWVDDLIKEYGYNEAYQRMKYNVSGKNPYFRESAIWVTAAWQRFNELDPENSDIEMAKGGLVVTSIKDIPNFKERLDEGKITYRGLGMGKLFDDFYKLAGTSGTRIKVDGKEYYITDKEFDTFYRGADGKLRVRFDAPYRKSYAEGGEMAKGGRVKTIKESDIQVGKKFELANGTTVEIKRLFKKNTDEDWCEYTYSKSHENSVNYLKNFINNWRKYCSDGGRPSCSKQEPEEIVWDYNQLTAGKRYRTIKFKTKKDAEERLKLIMNSDQYEDAKLEKLADGNYIIKFTKR